MKRRELEIRFQSDWYIGSGTGIPGSIDSQVLRDADGLPYIPGKTLTGILRDAAEWIADMRAAHDGDAKRWRSALVLLFGEQPDNYYADGYRAEEGARGAFIGVSSAVLKPAVRQYLNPPDGDSRMELIDALFSVRPGVSIDPDTGRAENGKLYWTERVRNDCVLSAYVCCIRELDEEGTSLWDNCASKLLNDAVHAVRRIGGKRRRGAGSCKLEWVSDWQDDSDILLNNTAEADNYNDLRKVFRSGSDVLLDIRLTIKQPVIINKTTLGNTVKSEMIVPGTVMLPYFANDVFGAIDRDCMRNAVMRGDISAGTLLPEIEGKTVLPVPLCLGKEKTSGRIINRFITQTDDKQQVKDIRSGYISFDGSGIKWNSSDSRRIIRTHNTIADDVQRPSEGVGGLYTYEAIGAGSKFCGTLHISASLAALVTDDMLRRLAHGTCTLGRSRKDEYGDAEYKAYVRTDSDSEDIELICGKGSHDNEKYLIVYLQSDLLLRGQSGGWSLNLQDLKEVLENELGEDGKLQLYDDDSGWERGGGDVRINPLGGSGWHRIRFDRRESWHTKWGLPRQSLLYFRAGCVFIFKAANPENFSADKAARLIRDGIGERRAEGYGRILINPPFLNPNKSESVIAAQHDENVRDSGTEEQKKLLPLPLCEDKFIHDLAWGALKRTFRCTARREAYAIVNSEKASAFENFPQVKWDDKPSDSQFGTLREIAASIDATDSMDIFSKWAKALEIKQNTEHGNVQWKADWIKMFQNIATDPHIVWNMRSAFGNIKSRFIKILPDINGDEASRKFLAAFLDVLCEAVFDKG